MAMVSDALSGKWRLTKEQLKSFFSSAALSYRYVVLVPRRCLNLWQMVRDDVEKLTPGTRWVTDIGMLSFVADVAKEYLQTGCFAPVLYIDDVLVHGQALNRRIRRYVRLVMSSLEEQGSSTFINLDDARQKLLDAIDIRVMFRNDDKLLMSRELSYRVSSQYTCSREELQRKSLDISEFLANDSRIANTSYVVSAFFLPKEFDETVPSTWQKWDVPYLRESLPNSRTDNTSCRLHLWLNDSVATYGCYPVIRSHRGQEVWQYTPYMLHPPMSAKHCDFILNTLMILVSKKIAHQELTNQRVASEWDTVLLNALQLAALNDSKMPVELKAHVLEMFLAQVVLACFFSNKTPRSKDTTLHLDIDKIATNFGDVFSKEALILFCKLDWDLSDLQLLCSCFKQSDDFYFDATTLNVENCLTDQEMDCHFRKVFNQMLACGCLHNLLQEGSVLRSQHYAISPREYGLFVSEDPLFDEDQRDYNLNKYLDDCSKYIAIRNQADVHCVIAALLSLMDLGLFSLRLIITASNTADRCIINQSMRHTEISLSALQYLFKPLWGEFETIASFCNTQDISIQRFLSFDMNSFAQRLDRYNAENKPAWLLHEVAEELDSNCHLFPCVFGWK